MLYLFASILAKVHVTIMRTNKQMFIPFIHRLSMNSYPCRHWHVLILFISLHSLFFSHVEKLPQVSKTLLIAVKRTIINI